MFKFKAHHSYGKDKDVVTLSWPCHFPAIPMSSFSSITLFFMAEPKGHMAEVNEKGEVTLISVN